MNPLNEVANMNVIQQKRKKRRKLNPNISKPLYAGLHMTPAKPMKLAAALPPLPKQPTLGGNAEPMTPAVPSPAKPMTGFTPPQATTVPKPFGGKMIGPQAGSYASASMDQTVPAATNMLGSKPKPQPVLPQATPLRFAQPTNRPPLRSQAHADKLMQIYDSNVGRARENITRQAQGQAPQQTLASQNTAKPGSPMQAFGASMSKSLGGMPGRIAGFASNLGQAAMQQPSQPPVPQQAQPQPDYASLGTGMQSGTPAGGGYSMLPGKVPTNQSNAGGAAVAGTVGPNTSGIGVNPQQPSQQPPQQPQQPAEQPQPTDTHADIPEGMVDPRRIPQMRPSDSHEGIPGGMVDPRRLPPMQLSDSHANIPEGMVDPRRIPPMQPTATTAPASNAGEAIIANTVGPNVSGVGVSGKPLPVSAASIPPKPPAEPKPAESKPAWASRFSGQIAKAQRAGNTKEVKRLTQMQSKAPNVEKQTTQRAQRSSELASIQAQRANKYPTLSRTPDIRSDQWVEDLAGSSTRPDGRPYLPETERMTRESIRAGRDDYLRGLGKRAAYGTGSLGNAWRFSKGLASAIGGGLATGVTLGQYKPARNLTMAGLKDVGRSTGFSGLNETGINAGTGNPASRSASGNFLEQNRFDHGLIPETMEHDWPSRVLYNTSKFGENVGTAAMMAVPVAGSAAMVTGAPMASPNAISLGPTLHALRGMRGAGRVLAPLAGTRLGKWLAPQVQGAANYYGLSEAIESAKDPAVVTRMKVDRDNASQRVHADKLEQRSDAAEAIIKLYEEATGESATDLINQPSTPEAAPATSFTSATVPETAPTAPEAVPAAPEAPATAPDTELTTATEPEPAAGGLLDNIKGMGSEAWKHYKGAPMAAKIGIPAGLLGLVALAIRNQSRKNDEEKEAAVWAAGDPKPKGSTGNLTIGTVENGGVYSYGDEALKSMDGYMSSVAKGMRKKEAGLQAGLQAGVQAGLQAGLRKKRVKLKAAPTAPTSQAKQAELIEECRQRGWSIDKTADYIYQSKKLLGVA